jgi:dolichyl-phosphate-mannose-protein mannosyltransferase
VARTDTEVEQGCPPARRPWTRVEIAVLLALMLAAGLLRFVDLGDPSRLMFDEVYYAKDACSYFEPFDRCTLNEPQTEVHPPLGKWLIGAGIEIFGYDSFGWRFASALAGTITVGLLFALGRRLLRSLIGASLAAGLLAIDFLHIVQSRISMLDIFVPMFGVAAFLFLVIDRDRSIERVERGERLPARILGRPWRAAAGAMAGAAVVTKWSGGLVLVSVILLAVMWESAAYRRSGSKRWFADMFVRGGPNLALYLLLLPAAVYVLSYIGRLDGDVFALPWSDGSWVQALVDEQKHMWSFHQNLEATHHYQSPGWSWLLLKRPVAYFYEDLGNDNVQEVMAFGSPFVWWSSILALLFALFNWIRTRDMMGPESAILVGFGLSYLPWLLPPVSRSAIFLFYLLPAIPFMCLAVAYALTHIGWSWEARAAQALFAAGAIAAFVYFQPLLYKTTISRAKWDSRIWFDDFEKGCERPVGTPTTTTVTEVTQGEETVIEKETTDNGSMPPTGWCWV